MHTQSKYRVRRGRTVSRDPKVASHAVLRVVAGLWAERLEDRVLLSAGLVSDHLFGTQGSSLGQVVDLNGTAYFTAVTPSPGLWKSNGTPGGTALLHDFGLPAANLPTQLAAAGGAVYFSAPGTNNDVELWRSDGTPGGTSLLKDIAVGINSSSPGQFTDAGGTVFFTADDGNSGRELWKTDGTAAGTALVQDIKPGTAGSDPQGLTASNGIVYFSADDGVHGRELWRSDGTAAGTSLVKEIRPGGLGAQVSGITNVSGTLFFAAGDGVANLELWKSDGTADGTTMVKDIDSGLGSSSPSNLANVGGTLFFSAFSAASGTELWKSDGTASGTVLVKDISGGVTSSNPSMISAAGATAVFSANDGSGLSLWSSDGSNGGTVKLPVANPGLLMSAGGRVYFSNSDAAAGAELWSTDGTIGGTGRVRDINPGSAGSVPTLLGSVGGMLYFGADDGFHGAEPWRTDGTAAGTEMVADLNKTPIAGGGSPTNLTAAGAEILYNSTAGSSLYGTDGTPDAAARLGTVTISGTAVAVGQTYFFAGTSGGNTGLWKTDGTPAGTMLLKALAALPTSLTPSGATVVFSGRAVGASTPQLWSSNGTPAGTGPLVGAGGPAMSPRLFTAAGNVVFFAVDSAGGSTLWKTDGTPAGTGPAKLFSSLFAIQPFDATSVLVIVGNDVLRTDGTNAGTTDLAVPAMLPADGHVFVGGGGVGYFLSHDSLGQTILCRTDGTVAGTAAVLTIAGSSGSDFFFDAALLGSKVLFVRQIAGNPIYDVWGSDGTAAGTGVVLHLYGTYGSSTSPIGTIVSSGGVGYFVAQTPFVPVGTELWRSDATSAGTMPVADLSPGTASSNPAFVSQFNGSVVFTASDGARAPLIWEAFASTLPPAPITGLTAVALSASQVALSWQEFPSDVSAIRVERSTASDFSDISGTYYVAPGATGYTDVMADPGVRVYYRVTAFNTAGAAVAATSLATPFASPNGVSLMNPNPQDWFSTQGVSEFRHQAVFIAYSYNAGYNAFRSDGVTSTQLSTFAPDSVRTSSDGRMIIISQRLSVGVYQYWQSDGTGQVLVPYSFPPAVSPQPSPYFPGSVFIGNRGFYSTQNSSGLSQVYVSNGTPAGTVQLTNFTTTPGNIVRDLTVVGSTVYFVVEANGGPIYNALWKTDGTPQNTVQVKTFSATRFDYHSFTAVGNRLFFEDGGSLWTSDGTTAGTVILKTAGYFNDPSILSLAAFQGRIYFATDLAAGTGPSGKPLVNGEVWSSNGTVAGTTKLPGLPYTQGTLTFPVNLQVLDDMLLFRADRAAPELNDSTQPTLPGLYRYIPAGTLAPVAPTGFTAVVPAGTEVDLAWTDAAVNSSGFLLERSTVADFATIDKSVTLTVGVSAYVDSGVTRGQTYYYRIHAFNRGGASLNVVAGPVTVQITPADPGGFFAVAVNGTTVNLRWTDNSDNEQGFTLQRSIYPDFSIVNAVFTAQQNATAYADSGVGPLTHYYYRLWAYNSVGKSAILNADVMTPDVLPLAPSGLTAGGISGTQVALEWTDNSNNESGFAVDRAQGGGAFVQITQVAANSFTYTDTVPDVTAEYQYRVRAVNTIGGTASNVTGQVSVAPPLASTFFQATPGSTPSLLTNVNGTVFFVANGLWKTDGTAAGTVQVSPIGATQLTAVNGTLYFVATDPSGTEVWKSDGTPQGTVLVDDVFPGFSFTDVEILGSIGNKLLFLETIPTNPYQLWETDGTVAGTARLAADVSIPGNILDNRRYAVSHGVLYFNVSSPVSGGNVLWQTDGTAAGTHGVGGIVTTQSGGDYSYDLTDVNGTLFFGAFDDAHGLGLWKVTDATSNAVLVKDVTNGSFPALDRLTAVGGKLFFFDADAVNPGLWTSDGTTGGTVFVAKFTDNLPIPTSPPPALPMVDMNGTAYFIESDAPASVNFEYTLSSLWKSDGTAAGTVRIAPVHFQHLRSPFLMLPVNGLLFYSDGVYLWRSDGTLPGTYRVGQVGPTTGGDSNRFFIPAAALGTSLLFTPYAPGTELDFAPTVPPSAPGGFTVAGVAGGNQVNWTDAAGDEAYFVIDRSLDPGFATLDRTFTAPAGAASFTDTTAAAGTTYYYRVRAFSSGGYSSAAAPLVAVAPVTHLLSTQVNDGSAQRSLVTSYTLRFDHAVTLSAGAVTLARLNTGGSGLNDGSAPTDVSLGLSFSSPDGGLTWVVTFAGSAGADAFGSLSDGVYALSLHPALVLDAAGNPLAGAAQVFTFHRLFGDANGDGKVSGSDFTRFSNAFGSKVGDANYLAAFDFNHDGKISGADFTFFSLRFGMKLVLSA